MFISKNKFRILLSLFKTYEAIFDYYFSPNHFLDQEKNIEV
jgi:hypothetical protein